MKEVARGEPIALRAALPRPGELSACPRAGQSRCAVTSSCSKQPWVSSGPSSGGRGRGEVGVVLPHCPGDARQLVGEGDGRFVVAAEALEVQRPGAQRSEERRVGKESRD